MLSSTEYSQIKRSFDKLGFAEQMQLFEYIKRKVESHVKPKPKKRISSWLGCLSDKTNIVGDIISPVVKESDWEVLSE